MFAFAFEVVWLLRKLLDHGRSKDSGTSTAATRRAARGLLIGGGDAVDGDATLAVAGLGDAFLLGEPALGDAALGDAGFGDAALDDARCCDAAGARLGDAALDVPRDTDGEASGVVRADVGLDACGETALDTLCGVRCGPGDASPDATGVVTPSACTSEAPGG